MNKAILIGNVGSDPEIRHTKSGTSVATVRLATTRKVNGQSETQWHSLVIWDKLAEIAEKYVSKGDKLSVIGEITYRKWQDKNTGQDRYSTEINVRELELLGGSRRDESEEHAPRQPQKFGQDFDDFNDDIPF